jgi:hypothetical protein
MPDVRGKSEQTLSLSADFATEFARTKHFPTTDLMMVIQIEKFEELPRFMAQVDYIQKQIFPAGNRMFTIGIPRRLTETLGFRARIHIVEFLSQAGWKNPFHLLGFSRATPPVKYNEIKALWVRVRSMDTDAPFVWAYNSIGMRSDRTPPERPKDYMNLAEEHLHSPRVYDNILALDGWAHGDA